MHNVLTLADEKECEVDGRTRPPNFDFGVSCQSVQPPKWQACDD